MDRLDMFIEELDYLKDESYKKALLNLINMLPEYFFHEERSSFNVVIALYSSSSSVL